MKLDPDAAKAWTDEEVVRRWGRLFPPRDKARQPLPVTNDWVQARLNETGWVAKTRAKLQSLSWFMMFAVERIERLSRMALKASGFAIFEYLEYDGA